MLYFSAIKKTFQKLEAGLKARLIPFLSFAVVFLLLAAYLSHQIFYSVMPGEAGVYWSRFHGGTRVDYIYPEGMHAIPPWDKMYIYTVRIQEIHPEFDVLTNTGLKVHLYLSIRYAPKYKLLGLLHRNVGPDYPNRVITPEITAVLREVIGTMGAEQIYTTGRAVIVEAINLAIERVSQRYIDVDGVLIKGIELPPSVAKAIQYKAEQKHLVEAHTFIVEKEKKEAERKRIEGEGIRDQLRIISSGLPEGQVLEYMGIKATLELARSVNSKVIVVGSGKNGLPLIGTVPMDSVTDMTQKNASPDNPSAQDIPGETAQPVTEFMNIPETQEGDRGAAN
jgi:regulator of protease activity HflC (stomatin/prohibitin superfamily)